MQHLTFITGNQSKVDYLVKWLGLPVEHHKLDLDELQSLDPLTVVEHKARQAYAILGRPVLVEDVSLVFHGMGRLPGTLIKWFLEEIGPDGLAKLGQGLVDKTATATVMYGLFDGKQLVIFEGHTDGTLAAKPRSGGDNGWKTSLSWNSIFIPNGSSKTYAQMDDDELKPFSHRAKAIEKLKNYLTNS